MKVLVTAGATTEQIDEVRSITNFSTGRLGSLIADSFALLNEVETIYYLCNKQAIQPRSEKTRLVYIDSVASLEAELTNLLAETNIDVIVHSMAVSDYRVRSVDTLEHIAGVILDNNETLRTSRAEGFSEAINRALNDASVEIGVETKINSDVENLVLILEKTPKVISAFHNISPSSTVVGFKLMSAVTVDTLIETGYRLLQSNNCSFVLANDLRDINEQTHIGYLIDEQGGYTRYSTKEEIARAITEAVIQKRTFI